MKTTLSVAVMFLTGATFSTAQITTPTSDVLGAHLNSGRGCAACHAPHSSSNGNGTVRSVQSAARGSILWGEDVTGLYGKTITTGGGAYVEVLPTSVSAPTPDAAGMLTCLGCHDGNYAPAAMMKNRVYENLPATYGTQNSIPTLLGGNGGSSYVNEHPMGLSATVACGRRANGIAPSPAA